MCVCVCVCVCVCYRDESIPDLEKISDDKNRAIHEHTAKLMAEQVRLKCVSRMSKSL